MENCELNDATVIAEALLHKSTAALKQLNLRRNRISGEWVGMFGIFTTSNWKDIDSDSTDPILDLGCFWGKKHPIVQETVASCAISFKFIRWGIADLGPLEDVMQQRPGLIIEMTGQKLGKASEAGNAESAECSAGVSEWSGHEAAWLHCFAKKWRFVGHQFNKRHAQSVW